jgi:hypothetical protein
MDTLVAQIAPPSRNHDHDELNDHDSSSWGSMAGFGNLARNGGIKGMDIPRVPDVS